MTANEIQRAVQCMGGLYIPEFTYGDHRIDAVLIDIRERNVRGFEIKVDRKDFLKDKKWQLYSRFCSSLSIACPAELIAPHEVSDPFGLLWVAADGSATWKKRAKNIQHRESLAWTWAYLSVLEKEIPRLVGENGSMKERLAAWDRRAAAP